MGLYGVLEYATDLFDRASVEAMADRLVRLLEAAAADPDRAIGGLDILAPEERHTILRAWNDTARPVPAATLPAAVRGPGRPAPPMPSRWCSKTQRLTYAELDARANQLAHHLRAAASAPKWLSGCASSARPR